jgi:hypothetical protein
MPDFGAQTTPTLPLDAETRLWLRHGCGTHLEVELDIAVAEGDDLFLEGHGGARTFVASLQLAAGRRVARRLMLTCPLVPPPPVPAETRLEPLLPLLERYLGALNDARFDEAGACFARDCLYVHPPYRSGEPYAMFRGRAELVRSWALVRGSRRVDTRIDRCVEHGTHGFVEGVAAGGSFLSSLVRDEDGLISRYVAFHTAECIPRLPVPPHVRPLAAFDATACGPPRSWLA